MFVKLHESNIKTKNKKMKTALIVLGCLVVVTACHRPAEENSIPEKTSLSQEELILRGKYLTTIGGCNDCHSPKVLTQHGLEPDTTRLLSGHPQSETLAPINNNQDWVLFSPGLTAF